MEVDNGVTRLNRGNSAGTICEFRAQNGNQFVVASTGIDVSGNADVGGDLDVGSDATFQGDAQFDGSTSGISYNDLSNQPTIGPHTSSDGLYLDRSGNDSYIVFKESGTQYGQIRSAKDDGGGIKVTASGGSTIWSQWKSDGNHEFEKGIIVKGTAQTGWHTKNKIWIPPSEFVINDDNAYGNLAMVDSGGYGKVMYSNMEAYANIPIPSGYEAQKFRINGTASVVIGAWYSDITTSTTTSCSPPATIYTNTEYSFYQSPVGADDTNGRYIILKWNPTTTSQYLYGAYITLVRT